MTKIAVVGSRTVNHHAVVNMLIDLLQDVEDVALVSGGAKGADTGAEMYAEEYNVPIVVHLPDWEGNGKAAGFIRNKRIEESSDSCIAFWDGESKGTRNTIDLFLDAGKPVNVIIVGER